MSNAYSEAATRPPVKTRYDGVTLFLHWSVALLILVAFAIAQGRGLVPRGPERTALMDLHRSLGVLVLALVALRMVWRAISPPPPMPADTAPLLLLAAKAGHLALYALMIAVPLAGVLMTQANGHPVSVFGLFTLPALVGEDKAFGHTLEEAHELLGTAIIVLAGLHAVAALVHQYVLKDGTLSRMLPWGNR
ncbi:cytochrome b [Azospirillum sp. YIM DDC1]|uniref:Cytochrome b n=1 Tax=Azospirillum aestuarii TaxID=2802052 RepID=A0ABS1HT88_9PROT|nr:cytochrome b [Azospirillum aestuarii]MBK4718045.1 cytochrome b [Azospirillum aestuarii]TWA92939.1 cytochrome b561 [Azospirillum brasilense]